MLTTDQSKSENDRQGLSPGKILHVSREDQRNYAQVRTAISAVRKAVEFLHDKSGFDASDLDDEDSAGTFIASAGFLRNNRGPKKALETVIAMNTSERSLHFEKQQVFAINLIEKF